MLRDVIIESLTVVTINFDFLLRHTVRNSNSTMQYLDDDFHISHSSGDSKKFKRGILGKRKKGKEKDFAFKLAFRTEIADSQEPSPNQLTVHRFANAIRLHLAEKIARR